MATAWKTTARKLQNEIRSITKVVHREGKTDAVENLLDQLEDRIGNLGESKEEKAFAKKLKDQLDQVK